MKFIENIKFSIYNPEHYKEILNKPFSFSLRYFLSLAVLIAVISTIVFSFSILPKFNKFVAEVSPKILNYYPENLEVTVKSGKVSTNVPEPYFIKLPSDFKNSDQGDGIEPPIEKMDNLLVIDTRSPLTAELFRSYKTAALLGYDSFAYDDNGAIKIQPLDQSINGVVTKEKVSAVLNKVMPFVKVLPLVLVPIVFVGVWLGIVLGNLIYLIFGAFMIWIFARIIKKDFSYGKSYQIGLHAITIGVILEATIFWFYPNLEFSFLFTIIMLAVIWVNFSSSSNVSLPEQKDANNTSL